MSTCTVAACTRPQSAKGVCRYHYGKAWRASAPPRPYAPCAVERCTRGAHAQGLCPTHYSRLRRTGTTAPKPHERAPKPQCRVGGCAKQSVYVGLCRAHYHAHQRYGDPTVRLARARGTGSITSSGYLSVACPRDFTGMATAAGRVLEHRLVMAQHLGRCLLAAETVHHRDGDRLNNALKNLDLRVGAHGKGVSVADAVAHASAILRRYASELLA